MSVSTSSGATFIYASSGNVLCLVVAGVCTQCQLLECLGVQQDLLKEPHLSSKEVGLSQELCKSGCESGTSEGKAGTRDFQESRCESGTS